MVYSWCRELDANIECPKAFDWCRSTTTQFRYPFDIYVPKYNVIVEVDGIQHFEVVKLWNNNLNETQQRDNYKMQCCLEHGLRFIRISQQDVRKHPKEWKPKLLEAIIKTEFMVQMLSKDESLYDRHWELSGLRITEIEESDDEVEEEVCNSPSSY